MPDMLAPSFLISTLEFMAAVFVFLIGLGVLGVVVIYIIDVSQTNRNSPTAPCQLVASPGESTSAIKMLNKTIAVASLKRLSPSRRMLRRSGALVVLSNASTDTGSVADSKAPVMSAAIHGNPEGCAIP